MHFPSFLAAAASLAATLVLASPTAVVDIRSRSADKIQVKWILDNASKRVSVDVYAKDGQSKLLKSSICQPYIEGQGILLNSDAFAAIPIALNISADAIGEISYAGKKYIATDVPESNGGVYCTSVYNDEAALLDCQIPWTNAKAAALYPIDGDSSCFQNGSPAAKIETFSRMQGQERSELPRSVQPEPEPVTDITPRACQPRQATSLNGNGNPKPAHLQVQISAVNNCGDGSCSVGYSESISYTIGWSLSGSLPGGWISGGFSVSQTTTTGNNYQCSADRGQSVCIWSAVEHVAYKVVRSYDDDCTGWKKDYSQTGILKSPKNGGTSYYCVRGTCRTRGERYWDPNDQSP